MKKCASCTKDLPDAALHCVFCGAKQPPAPATSGGLAKTAFGAYSASDMMDHLKGQQGGGGYQPPRPAPSPAPAPYRPPAPAAAPTYSPPAPAPPVASPYQAPAAPARPNAVPAVSSAAPTMMVAPGGGPPNNFARPNPQPYAPQPMSPLSMPTPQPVQPMPVAPIPMAAPPYLASQTAARAGRPIEPWKDSLRLMMFVWGGALIAAFATPVSIDPLAFNWDAIIGGAGTQKLPPLIMVAVGLLSIVLSLIPTSPLPRGLIAGVLGLAGILVPMLIVAIPPWQVLVPLAGMILLIPGLLVRHEYRDSILPRILVTVGALASLVVYLLPANDSLPIVDIFKGLIDAPGSLKILPILLLGQITIVVLSLLAWLPSPSSGGAKVFAWLLILYPVVVLVTLLLVSGAIGDVLTEKPYQVVAWVAGGATGGKESAGFGVALGVAYAVLVGYGFATVIGKKLE